MGRNVNVPDKDIREAWGRLAYIAWRYGTELIISENDARRLCLATRNNAWPKAGDRCEIMGRKAHITAT
jgi:hypothetical protein